MEVWFFCNDDGVMNNRLQNAFTFAQEETTPIADR